MPPVIYVAIGLPGFIRCPVDATPPVTLVKWKKDDLPLRIDKVILSSATNLSPLIASHHCLFKAVWIPFYCLFLSTSKMTYNLCRTMYTHFVYNLYVPDIYQACMGFLPRRVQQCVCVYKHTYTHRETHSATKTSFTASLIVLLTFAKNCFSCSFHIFY